MFTWHAQLRSGLTMTIAGGCSQTVWSAPSSPISVPEHKQPDIQKSGASVCAEQKILLSLKREMT